MKYLVGFLKTEWGCGGVSKKLEGLPQKSFHFQWGCYKEVASCSKLGLQGATCLTNRCKHGVARQVAVSDCSVSDALFATHLATFLDLHRLHRVSWCHHGYVGKRNPPQVAEVMHVTSCNLHSQLFFQLSKKKWYITCTQGYLRQ